VEYREFFQALTGRTAYPYQERLADALFGGESVVLRAPTGAGKTWATIAPLLYARCQGTPIGDRLLYTLPAPDCGVKPAQDRAGGDRKETGAIQ
jgi:CRISPR-associated endonuclease/helicase Cas3